MEKQIPSIPDSKPMLVFEGEVHFPLINTALRASLPQNEEEETFWGFLTRIIKKTPKHSTASFHHPVLLVDAIADLHHQNHEAGCHYSTRCSLVRCCCVLLMEKLKESLSSWQIQKRSTSSLISSRFICTLIHLGGICP